MEIAIRKIENWLDKRFRLETVRTSYWHRIRVTLVSVLLVIAGNSIFGLLHFITEKTPIGGIYSYCAVLSYLLPLGLLYFRYYYLAKVILGLLFIINTFIFTYLLYQPELLNYLFFIVVPPFCNMIFAINERKTKWLLSLSSIALMVYCITFPHENYLIELSPQDQMATNIAILLTVMVVIATTIAVILADLEYSEKQLIKMATIDELTGLYNRAAFHEHLRNFMTHNDKAVKFSLMFIDVDKFKLINDTYGHAVGDRVLHRLGQILQAQTRSSDIVSRFGGDEFVIFLPKALGEQALVVGERIKKAINHVEILGVDKKISVSIGISECAVGEDPEQLISQVLKNADKATYQSKSKGGNQVVLAPLLSQSVRFI